MNIVLEESDETLFELEIISDKKWIKKSALDIIWNEGNELTSIFVAPLKTMNNKIKKSGNKFIRNWFFQL